MKLEGILGPPKFAVFFTSMVLAMFGLSRKLAMKIIPRDKIGTDIYISAKSVLWLHAVTRRKNSIPYYTWKDT